MPFLGNTPANTFVSIAKQTITGNGGTSYSLSYAVTSANDIDVFYNNVRQEPGVAYTANATTITFTEAIQSTDSVYILFNGQAVGTIDAPAGAYLPTTGGTVNGQLSVNNKIQIQQDASSNNRLILRGTSGSSYRWNIDNFGSSNQFRIFRENDSDATSGIVAAQLDSAGRLTLPQQPVFAATLNSNIAANSSAQVIPMNNAITNIGGCYNTSTYRFTAPVTGSYQIQFKWESVSGTAPAYSEINVRKNGSLIQYGISYKITNSTEYSGCVSRVYYLNAGDYMDVYYSNTTAGGILAGEAYTVFSGYLIG